MNTCRCGAQWTGQRRAHCSVCHVTFDGVGQFDAHRRGTRDEPFDGACRTPASLGLVAKAGVWMTPESAAAPRRQPPRGPAGIITLESTVDAPEMGQDTQESAC